MHRPIPITFATRAVAIFTLFAAGVNLRAQTKAADVPVKEVVLFSSGVGYFQHEGSVTGDAAAQLRFKTGQINDILKSLVLQDLGGGRSGVVTYPSQDPLARTLGSFQVDISDNPSLGDLLNKLRGARVAVAFAGVNGPENFSAIVLGVEKRQVPAGRDGTMVDKEFVNVVTDRGIRSLELEKVDRFQLEDVGLQDELNRALAAVAGARDQDKKPVDIRFNGTGERKVRVGYVVETPIWKASYRLVLADDKANSREKGGIGTLQGWALVDNQTDNDWNNVKLSLVSGRPLSFQQDLYQPLYVSRPTIVPEQFAALRSPVYENGENTPNADAANPARSYTQSAKRSEAQSRPQPAGMLQMQQNMVAAPVPPPPADATVEALSDTSQIGELFQYTVGNVNLARQSSAMIPIINDPVRVDRLCIYNESVMAKHPLNGVRLHNNTEDRKHLLQGPITVYDSGGYAGDARIDDVPPGETRLLSYGVDLQTDVSTKSVEPQQSIQTGKIVKGVLQLTRKTVSAKEYTLDNKSERDRDYVLEHPMRGGWKLVDTPAPYQTTSKFLRFALSAAAGKKAALTVREEYIQGQTVELVSTRLDEALVYSRMGEIPSPVRDALMKAATLKRAAADTEAQVTEHDSQIKTLASDQNRIRENLKSVDRTTSYATRLLKKLDDQESQIDKLRNETDTLRGKLEGQQRDLQTYLENLSVE